MIKDALNFLLNQNIEPVNRLVEFADVNGNDRTFFINNDGNAIEVFPKPHVKDTILVRTLTSFVDFLKNRDISYFDKLYIHIENEETVSALSEINNDGKREYLITAKATLPHFEYEHFYSTEELIIALQSKFVQTQDRDILLKVVGNIKEENVRETGDDGVSQAVTVLAGITSVADVKVPNPVELAPYRTFLEVEQPVSKFIFRMKDGPRGAIFEADGGAWRHEAIHNIKKYLEQELAKQIEKENFIIIA